MVPILSRGYRVRAPAVFLALALVRSALPAWSRRQPRPTGAGRGARADGKNVHQVTKSGYDISDLAWSPDGKSITASLNREASLELVLIDPATGDIRGLHGGMGYHSRAFWAPDGRSLTFEFESPVTPPDIYQIDIQTQQVKQLTYSQPLSLAANKLVMPEKVRYQSFDELEIPALLYKPAEPNGAGIVNPHGGPSSQYLFEFDILVQYLVAKGYTVLAPNYRGSTGYGVEFEPGGGGRRPHRPVQRPAGGRHSTLARRMGLDARALDAAPTREVDASFVPKTRELSEE